MEKRQTIITTNTSEGLIPDTSISAWFNVGIIVLIVIIFIGIFLIYWLLIRKPSILEQISKCPVYHLPSKFHLSQTFGKSKVMYYLDAAHSVITRTQPTTSFSYDYVNQILSINNQDNNNKINVNNQGRLNAGIVGYPLVLVTNSLKSDLVQIQYLNEFILSYEDTSGSNTIDVFFPKPNLFGSVPLMFTVQPVTNVKHENLASTIYELPGTLNSEMSYPSDNKYINLNPDQFFNTGQSNFGFETVDLNPINGKF